MASREPTGGRLVVVPCDPAARPAWKRCVAVLQTAGHLVRTLETLRQAIETIGGSDNEVAVMVVGETRGVERNVTQLLAAMPDGGALVVAGVPPLPLGRACVLAGAYVTLSESWPDDALERAVRRAMKHCRALRREARFDPREPLARLLGASDSIRQVGRLVARAAGSSTPVLVIGEVGAGKMVIARSIHAHERGSRRHGSFVGCILGGIEPDYLQEELYGTESRPGVFERAHGGTLLLDDIELLPRPDQVRLLELLRDGAGASLTRADGSARVPANVRLVAGSSIDLESLHRHRRLVDGLDDRLKVLPIRLPPLRQRLEDIALLAGALTERYASVGGRAIVGLAPRAVSLLQRYSWPGNIRELQERIERAVRRSKGPVLEAEDLADLSHMTAGKPEAAPVGTLDVSLSLQETLPLAAVARRAQAAAEVMAITRALRLTGGNVTRASKLLQVSRLLLQKRMKRYGLRAGPPESRPR